MLETYAYHNAQKGLEYAEKSLSLDPDNPYAYYVKGRALDVLGRRDEAKEFFKKCINFDPNSHLAQDILAHFPDLK